MPLYEYKCDACGHAFEKIVKFSDPPLEACPKCSGPVQKLFSSPAIQFKGSGWYITDYAKKSSGDSASKTKADTSDKSDSKSSDASSSSSTPTPAATSAKE